MVGLSHEINLSDTFFFDLDGSSRVMKACEIKNTELLPKFRDVDGPNSQLDQGNATLGREVTFRAEYRT